jgi:hypothetical protein
MYKKKLKEQVNEKNSEAGGRVCKCCVFTGHSVNQKITKSKLSIENNWIPKQTLKLGYDHVQAYSVITYNFFWYKAYHFLGSSVISV